MFKPFSLQILRTKRNLAKRTTVVNLEKAGSLERVENLERAGSLERVENLEKAGSLERVENLGKAGSLAKAVTRRFPVRARMGPCRNEARFHVRYHRKKKVRKGNFSSLQNRLLTSEVLKVYSPLKSKANKLGVVLAACPISDALANNSDSIR